ncbi:hypothetical protein EYZ11_008199 [Aspergillus tanneri]|uniref:Uncharacterized protein n=1 Tax=Aspergillus tanneri TaxID=1220188 RepID=A0A4S3JB92_9EURO|nr:hypothetical protein EYZ11_008199 [Aspergillus tanneri]
MDSTVTAGFKPPEDFYGELAPSQPEIFAFRQLSTRQSKS